MTHPPSPPDGETPPAHPAVPPTEAAPPIPPSLIIGVGASAGGFEAFKELLEALPVPNGLAFLFIQHQDPNHQSMLPTLLGRCTRMRVTEATDGVVLEGDHVYVTPANANVIIMNGTLTLRPIGQIVARHKVIDFCLRSLANDQGSRAVGVLLSGTASDGVLGLKAIKAEGGITLVQEERTAKFDSMPRSAIMAGVADLVLPPAEIARELLNLKNHYPRLTTPPTVFQEEPLPLMGEKDDLRRILALVWTVSHVDFSAYKQSTLRRRIFRRMVLHKLDKLAHYVRFLEENPSEAKALYQDLVINVTSFFRDPDVFEALKGEILPSILAGKSPNTPLRIWIPGCSTGEEVYSLAITVLEALGDNKQATVHIQLFGTDISEMAVDKARAGIYPDNIEADVSPERLRRFFTKSDSGYQVSKPVRDLCIFARQNVFKDPPFSNLDLISCRNVLIYFGQELQKKVLPMFHYALNPNGFLLLGNSESIGTFADLFALAHKRHKLYSKKSISPRLILDLARGDYSMERQSLLAPLAEGLPKSFDPQKEADRLLLDRYSPPGVLVNSDLNILQFRGRTGCFLEPAPGGASFNLLRMAREGLMIPLHTAIHEATESGRAARKEDVVFKGNGNGDSYRANLEIIPIVSPHISSEKFFLALFQDLRPASEPILRREATEPAPSRPPESPDREHELERLRQELAATKEYLQSVIESQEAFNEELRSANEEILSSNEELQSTNEELETAKEELQSANEELTTLNEELQTRNEELAKLNDDLTNLLNSTNIAIVMLDNDLRVRRFTPCAEKMFSLIPTDIGRPFSDINPRISVPDLVPFIHDVLDTLGTKEVEVKDGQGRWYNLRVRPYKTQDNKIDGAVLAVVDINALVQSETNLDDTGKALNLTEIIINALREPFLVLGDDGRVKTANPSFYETFRTTPDGVQGRSLYTLNNGLWDKPALRLSLQDLAHQGNAFEGCVVEPYDAAPDGQRMVLNGRRLDSHTGAETLILLGIGFAPR
ncbi:CheR family methyltransferase [Methylomagnum ishizawai]|uniref:CheR family methyltransferase n=1 Tax=Methylomagnum ishizawai TaxID=1760988 RepID=UPI001C7EAC21|nr:CheR family methyltransferase [Methylomagnum ishizawai]